MNKYNINVHFDFVAHVEVTAPDEETALRLAESIAENMPSEELECTGTTGKCVTS